MPQKRIASARTRAVLLAKKFGVSKLHLKRKIEGKILYRNPNPISVAQINAQEAARRTFSLENVEWISIHENKHLGRGGFGVVSFGKVKFCGVANPQRVALKHYNTRSGRIIRKEHLDEVINAIRRSKVPCPKMATLEIMSSNNKKDLYLVMEFFGGLIPQAGKDKLVSKLMYGGEVPAKLVPSFHHDEKLFKKIVTYTAQLAKQNLALSKVVESDTYKARIDEFSLLLPIEGEQKLILHDIENMRFFSTPKIAWSESIERLLLVLSASLSPSEYGIAHGIIKEVSQKYGFE